MKKEIHYYSPSIYKSSRWMMKKLCKIPMVSMILQMLFASRCSIRLIAEKRRWIFSNVWSITIRFAWSARLNESASIIRFSCGVNRYGKMVNVSSATMYNSSYFRCSSSTLIGFASNAKLFFDWFSVLGTETKLDCRNPFVSQEHCHLTGVYVACALRADDDDGCEIE